MVFQLHTLSSNLKKTSFINGNILFGTFLYNFERLGYFQVNAFCVYGFYSKQSIISFIHRNDKHSTHLLGFTISFRVVHQIAIIHNSSKKLANIFAYCMKQIVCQKCNLFWSYCYAMVLVTLMPTTLWSLFSCSEKKLHWFLLYYNIFT